MISLDFPTLIRKIDRFKFPEVDLVVGIGSGGIVPAALVAYRLSRGLRIMGINYRDDKNTPCRPRPAILTPFRLPAGIKNVLLVDDVAVSGQTLQTASRRLKSCQVTTFVLKGKADLVLFPEIKDCVDWPWKKLCH